MPESVSFMRIPSPWDGTGLLSSGMKTISGEEYRGPTCMERELPVIIWRSRCLGPFTDRACMDQGMLPRQWLSWTVFIRYL